MITERDKAQRIIKAISSYFFAEQIDDFTLKIHFDSDKFQIKAVALSEQKPENFEQLLRELNVPREGDIDQYFNAMLGVSGQSQNYALLGRTIDEAKGNYSEGQLTLEIIRKIKT